MAVSSRDRRVVKELADIQADRDKSGVSAWPVKDGDLRTLRGSLMGPRDTVYADGKYEVEIKIPDNYPFSPPNMEFVTSVWHPNISSQTGAICLDTLKSAWSPVQTIKTALISLQLLLQCPNPEDPQDAEVARQMRNQPGDFAVKAHDWAVVYADAPRQQLDLGKWTNASGKEPQAVDYKGYNKETVEYFQGMGFTVPEIVQAMQQLGIATANGQRYQITPSLESNVINEIIRRRD